MCLGTDLEGGLRFWAEPDVHCSQCKVVFLIVVRFAPGPRVSVHLGYHHKLLALSLYLPTHTRYKYLKIFPPLN